MMCNKIGFITKREAKAALASAQAARDRYDSGHRERRTYHCRCGQYHLTSSPHRIFEPVAYAEASR